MYSQIIINSFWVTIQFLVFTLYCLKLGKQTKIALAFFYIMFFIIFVGLFLGAFLGQGRKVGIRVASSINPLCVWRGVELWHNCTSACIHVCMYVCMYASGGGGQVYTTQA